MPLVKGGRAGPREDPGKLDIALQQAALESPEAETRWAAARALAGHPDAVAPLASALAEETVQRVREAIMTALMRVGNDDSVKAMLPYLRAQDAGLRGTAIEALQGLPDAIAPFMPALFDDPDSDVRLLATELVRNMPAEKATDLLCRLITHEQHPNVCAAAIDVLAEVGTRNAIPAIERCASRFPATPFLPFAASVAIARLSGVEG